MSRPEEARNPAQDTAAEWYRNFAVELASHDLPISGAEHTTASTRAEAETAGVPPGGLYGPVVLYAREVTSALRDYQANAPASAPHSSSPHTTVSLGTIASAKTPPTTPVPVVLRLRNVSARRGGHMVLSDIDLTIHRDEVVAVVGASGASKPTLLQLYVDLPCASDGSIERTPNPGCAPQLDSLAPLLTVDEHPRLFEATRGTRQGRSISAGRHLLTHLG